MAINSTAGGGLMSAPSGFTQIPYADEIGILPKQYVIAHLYEGATITFTEGYVAQTDIYLHYSSASWNTSIYLMNFYASLGTWKAIYRKSGDSRFSFAGNTITCLAEGDYVIYSNSGRTTPCLLSFGNTPPPDMLDMLKPVVSYLPSTAKQLDDIVAEPLGVLTGFFVFTAFIAMIFKSISWR